MLVRQAIVTKYIGPSNVKGSRCKASAAAGSVTLHWNSALNSEDNHAWAAKTLALKFGWKGNWYQGGNPNDSGYCFVCLDAREPSPAFEV